MFSCPQSSLISFFSPLNISRNNMKGLLWLSVLFTDRTRLILLQPPIGADRAFEMGTWEEREIKVSGASWDVNSVDIAIAGLGWFSIGLKGEATLALWAYDGIEITLREPLVLDRARSLERPGFWLPKAISEAIGNQSKLEAQRKKLEMESTDFLSEASI